MQCQQGCLATSVTLPIGLMCRPASCAGGQWADYTPRDADADEDADDCECELPQKHGT